MQAGPELSLPQLPTYTALVSLLGPHPQHQAESHTVIQLKSHPEAPQADGVSVSSEVR